MKPCIKRRPFSRRSSAASKSARTSGEAECLSSDYLEGVSVFETLRAYDGKIFRAGEHLRRLAESCGGIGTELPLAGRWLHSSLAQSGFRNAILRVSIYWKNQDAGEIVLFVRPFESHPKEWYEKGVSIRSCVNRRPSAKAQNPQIKSSQYVSGVLAHLDRPGCHEYLFFSPTGTVAEGTVSNIFIFKQKTLLTPPVASGILKGVTRDFVLALAEKQALATRQTPLTRHEIYTAEECFITNTSSEILPVVEVDGRKIGSGRPGPLTRQLGGLFKKHR